MKTLLIIPALTLMMFASTAQSYNGAYKKALRLLDKDKCEESNHYFRIALEKGAEDLFMIYGSMAYNFSFLGNTDSALYYSQKAAEFPESESDATFKSNLAYIYWQMDNEDKSMELINEAIAMDSTMSVYYLNRGIFHADFACYMDACRDFEKAARMGEAEAKTLFEENNCESWYTPEKLKMIREHPVAPKRFEDSEESRI